jgi:DNA helicase IV
MDGFLDRHGTYLFRNEMFFALRSALQRISKNHQEKLLDAVWEVQNRVRHVGRPIGKRSIGSTLLVKGLEFDHAVIIFTERMTRRDWYVALTRATTSMTVFAPLEVFSPAES